MAELVADCPRCRAKMMTFNVIAQNYLGMEYDWQSWYEVFAICRHCKKSTTFVISLDDVRTKEWARDSGPVAYTGGAINRIFKVEYYISLKDIAAEPPPEYLPEDIRDAFNEGARSIAAGN